jgi:hypothetical protein
VRSNFFGGKTSIVETGLFASGESQTPLAKSRIRHCDKIDLYLKFTAGSVLAGTGMMPAAYVPDQRQTSTFLNGAYRRATPAQRRVRIPSAGSRKIILLDRILK